MATPPAVIFGPSGRADTWWAVLPSTTALHARTVSALISDVEVAMARDEPGRPFALLLDLYGTREPGPSSSVDEALPLQGSTAYLLAERRLPPRTPPDDDVGRDGVRRPDGAGAGQAPAGA